MKQVRFIGQDNRVLIDVGSFNFGDVFTVTDDLAYSLVASYPDSYELIDEHVNVGNDDSSSDGEDDEDETEKPDPLVPTRVSSSSSSSTSTKTTSTSTSTS